MEICRVGRFTRRQAEGWGAIEKLKMMAGLYALDQRKDAALSQLSARLAAGSDSERVAARLVMDDAEGAASIAARSSDAVAYRLALLRCRSQSDAAPSCRALTVQAWQQLDPQDARPWARLVAQAWERKDEAAAAQAVEEMLQRRPRGTFSPLLEAMFNARAAVADVEARGLLTVEMIGRDAGLPRDDIIFLRYCSAERVQDTARRARCERLARWQLEHANDLTDAMIATAIADRVALPAEQRPFTGEQLKRGQEWFMEQSDKVFGMSCTGLRRTSEWMEQRVQRGELKMVLQGAADR
ncbi:MAG TPA: hypothetical protein VGE36_13390 [Roseateles sp.]